MPSDTGRHAGRRLRHDCPRRQDRNPSAGDRVPSASQLSPRSDRRAVWSALPTASAPVPPASGTDFVRSCRRGRVACPPRTEGGPTQRREHLTLLGSRAHPVAPPIRNRTTGSLLPSRTGLLDWERPPREGGTGVYVPTLPDARTGHRKWGVAPSHGLKARFGIDESGGRGPTVMPSATCGISRVSRPRADFVSGGPRSEIHMSRSASGRAGIPIRTPSPRAASSPMLPPGATAPGRTAGGHDS